MRCDASKEDLSPLHAAEHRVLVALCIPLLLLLLLPRRCVRDSSPSSSASSRLEWSGVDWSGMEWIHRRHRHRRLGLILIALLSTNYLLTQQQQRLRLAPITHMTMLRCARQLLSFLEQSRAISTHSVRSVQHVQNTQLFGSTNQLQGSPNSPSRAFT